MHGIDEDPPPLRRRHGLHAPWDAFQGVALFAYTLFGATLFAVHVPLMTPSAFQAAAIVVLAVGTTGSVALYIIAALVPCHDVNLDEKYRDASSAPPGTRVCHYCEAYVWEKSKHCHACDKCVEDFDHHCRWLNHCVGDRNYVHFALFLGLTTVLLGLQSALGLFYFVEYFARPHTFMTRMRAGYSDNATAADAAGVVAFVFIVFVLELASAALIGHLCGLHVYLNAKGVSTYQYILANRKEQRDRVDERRRVGMPNPEDSPVCHELAVWQFERAQRNATMDAASSEQPHDGRYAVGHATTTAGDEVHSAVDANEGSVDSREEDLPSRGVSPPQG